MDPAKIKEALGSLNEYIEIEKGPLKNEIASLKEKVSELKRSLEGAELSARSWRTTYDESVRNFVAREDKLKDEIAALKEQLKKAEDVGSRQKISVDNKMTVWDLYAASALSAIPHIGCGADLKQHEIISEAAAMADQMMKYRP